MRAMSPRTHVLVHDGRRYDSKPILGATHGYQFRNQGPRCWDDFHGGQLTIAQRELLGFVMGQQPD